MKHCVLIATAALVGMAAITRAQATTYTFRWVTPSSENTNLGLSYYESSSGITLTACGLTAPANLTLSATAGPDRYARKGASTDTGLGLTSGAGGPGMSDDGVQVDFANVLADAPHATVTMATSSLQSGEGRAIYDSNALLTVAGKSKTDGTLVEPLLTGSGSNGEPTVTVNLPDWGEYTYYTLMATGPAICNSEDILPGAVPVNGGATCFWGEPRRS